MVQYIYIYNVHSIDNCNKKGYILYIIHTGRYLAITMGSDKNSQYSMVMMNDGEESYQYYQSYWIGDKNLQRIL